MSVARPARNATSTSTTRASTTIDLPTLMRIKSLTMRARVVVEGFYKGLHRSPMHGFSVEFSEYRPYTPGDDPRYLDWKLYARTDRDYIKKYEDETNLRCQIELDASRSMDYGSGSYTKLDYARTASATLASFLSSQRDAVGLLRFDDDVREYLPPRHRPGHLRRLLALLDAPAGGSDTALEPPLERIAATVRKRGVILLISDFLSPLDHLKIHLSYLKSRGHDVLVWRILDPAELDFPFEEASQFLDLESGREFYVEPDAARAEYRRRFQLHAEAVAEACRDLGIEYTSLTTDRPLEMVLFELIHARLRTAPQRGPTRRFAGGGAR